MIYRNGDATVGAWGRDVSMSKQVIAVRQDVTLLVDGGQAVAGLNPYDISSIRVTLGGIPNVWRAGVGVTANGALVYVYGPDMEVTQLARFARPCPARPGHDLGYQPGLDSLRHLQTSSRCAGVPNERELVAPRHDPGRGDLLRPFVEP